MMSVLASFTFFIFIQEIAVRFTFPQFDPNQQIKFYTADNHSPSLGKPNTSHRLYKNSGDYDVNVSFNKYGLRDENDLSLGTPNCAIVAGNSYAFGWGVEANERFSNMLNKNLEIEVYNLATTGGLKNIEQLLKYARDIGASCKRLIITVFTDAALRQQNAKRSTAKINNNVKLKANHYFERVKSFLSKNSSIYFLATHIIHNNPWLKKIAISAGLIIEINANPGLSPMTFDAVESTTLSLKKMAQGYDAIILLVPPTSLWDPDKAKETARIYDKLIEVLRKNKIKVFDPRNVFNKNINPLKIYYFAHDAHWTKAGHRVVADYLTKLLRVWN